MDALTEVSAGEDQTASKDETSDEKVSWQAYALKQVGSLAHRRCSHPVHLSKLQPCFGAENMRATKTI